MLLWYIILLVLINIFGILCVGFQHNVLGVSVRYEIPECRFMFYFLCFLDNCCNVHNLLLFMLDIV